MLISLAALGLAAAQPAAAGTLGEIRMHLFYQETGRLSPDISPPASFAGFNIGIGEGDAEERADDLLVVVELRSTGEQFIETPLRVVARGGEGNGVLGERRWESVGTGENGRAYLPLYLRDVGCAGEIRVTATFGSTNRSETLALECGE